MRNGPNCAPLATCSIRGRNVSRGGASAKWAKTSNRPLASSNTPTATGEGPHASSSACAIRSAAASSAAILASYKIGSAGAIAQRRCPRSARSCMARKFRRPRHQQANLRRSRPIASALASGRPMPIACRSRRVLPIPARTAPLPASRRWWRGQTSTRRCRRGPASPDRLCSPSLCSGRRRRRRRRRLKD